MQRCITLAKKGLGTTYPNPLVGSVIVLDSKIIGEGWHKKAGERHAEVIAINSVSNQSLLANATIYVSLEPCSHFGKTPPCADLIISSGIKNVVVGCLDPNPKVAGQGIEKLKNAGCKVTTGILEQECKQLNARFFTSHLKKRPYIILKWAQSADNFIAPQQRLEQAPVWLTNKASRQLVHKWRTQEQAILVGTRTALEDNPSLTARDWQGDSPLRIVIDLKHKLPANLEVFNTKAPTLIVANTLGAIKGDHIEYLTVSKNQELLAKLLNVLHSKNIQSIIIEGGSFTLNQFIASNLWDEARVFTTKKTLNSGVKAPNFNLNQQGIVQTIASDSLHYYFNTPKL